MKNSKSLTTEVCSACGNSIQGNEPAFIVQDRTVCHLCHQLHQRAAAYAPPTPARPVPTDAAEQLASEMIIIAWALRIGAFVTFAAVILLLIANADLLHVPTDRALGDPYSRDTRLEPARVLAFLLIFAAAATLCLIPAAIATVLRHLARRT